MNELKIEGLEPLVTYIIDAVAERVIERLAGTVNTQKALSAKEASERFGMCETQVKELFRRPGSPAYRIGGNEKSSWRVDEEDFKKFLQAQTQGGRQ